MMYAIYQTELLQRPDNQELVEGLVASAEQLLYLLPNAPAATQLEWVMQRFEKMKDPSHLPCPYPKLNRPSGHVAGRAFLRLSRRFATF